MMARRSSGRWILELMLAAGVLVGRGTGAAQDAPSIPPPAINVPVPASPGGPIHTLHVYMNLEQIPVLVLSTSRERMKPVEPSKFRVSLDSGPLFKPTHVRVEGDDPISLAVLIDATKPRSELLAKVEEAVAALADRSLKEQDRVSIYVMSCTLTRSAYNMPADPVRLRKALEEGLWPSHEQQAKGRAARCKASFPLWDAMTYATLELRRQPGWRVLLAVTDGEDQGSRNNWNQLKLLAQEGSVAVFGVSPTIDRPTRDLHTMQSSLLAAEASNPFNPEDPFDTICQLSGGLQTFTGARNLGVALQRVIQMVHERYIVEYPRANNDTAGIRTIVVTLDHKDAYVRPTGNSIPVLDPKVLADPTTLPSDPSNKPVIGNRRVLTPP